jgi:hypothetical protein
MRGGGRLQTRARPQERPAPGGDGAAPQRLPAGSSPDGDATPRCSLLSRAGREGRVLGTRRRRSAAGGRTEPKDCSECSLLGLAFGRKRSIGPSFGGLREVLKKIWAKFQGRPGPTWTTLWARHCM